LAQGSENTVVGSSARSSMRDYARARARDARQHSCTRQSSKPRGRWTDKFAGRALAWLLLEDAKRPSARLALPPAVYMHIATFLRFQAPLKDQIYAVGGRNRHLEDSSGYLNEVEMFDWFRGEWRDLPSISMKRVGAAVVCVDGCLYAAGGYCARISQPVASVEKYDPEREQWTTVAPMLGARYGHAMAAVDGKIYVMGGDAGGADRMLSSCEVYDPRENVWSEIARMPCKLAGGRVEVHGNKILYVGGCAEASLSDVVWAYDVETDVWEPFARMSVGRSAFALGRMELGGESQALVVAGGFLDEEAQGVASVSVELVGLPRSERAESSDDESPSASRSPASSTYSSPGGSPQSGTNAGQGFSPAFRARAVPPLPEQRSGCRAVTVKRSRVWSGADEDLRLPSCKEDAFDDGDCLVLLGGEEVQVEQDTATPSMYDSAWIFDSRTWRWVASDVVPPMRTGRTALGVCIAPGYPRSYGFYD